MQGRQIRPDSKPKSKLPTAKLGPLARSWKLDKHLEKAIGKGGL